MPNKVKGELNDRTQWNSSSGRENLPQRAKGPQVIPNEPMNPFEPQHGVKFTIGDNQARNLASRK